MAEKEPGWATGGRCGDCGHNEGTDDDGQCRFMFVASDPSQVVDTSPTNQCPHYCPRSVGERIARKYLPFHDYDKPLSKMGQQLAADIDSVSPSDAEQLSELRKAAQNALHWFESRDMGRHAPFVVAELRSVLNPKQPEKETQGK